MLDTPSQAHEALVFEGGNERGRYVAFCLPPNSRSLTLWPPDIMCHPEAASDIKTHLARAFEEYSAERVFVPNVGHHSGLIVPRESFDVEVALTDRTLVRVMSAGQADGCALGETQGFAMSTRGCALVVASGCEHMVAAHAGLGSLVDQKRIRTGRPSRTREGIIHAIAYDFTRKGIDLADVSLDVLFSIHPDEFRYPLDHPEHIDFNAKLFSWLEENVGGACVNRKMGSIDIAAIATGFAAALGFGHVSTKGTLRSTDGFALTGEARNLVGVVRRA